jgi:hypothetical protein
LTTLQEWRCGTDPTNALSVLRLVSVVVGPADVTVSWESVGGIEYSLERSSDPQNSRSGYTLVSSNIPGQPGTTSYTDSDPAPGGFMFYRVLVIPRSGGLEF